MTSLQKCDLANYADDSTLYASDKSISKPWFYYFAKMGPQ